ncbi:hypothetical protein [Bacillus altitudinis]|uniref:hypothetical protein n=1 Tax=Bacillus altitudinis TaxID=293387 RepID=UPI00203EBFB4|nr:hypothetical protein [Bacillus altitudinis]MCM3044209.1 hypothetical protein [Bacillus altitudinis]MEC1804305.1 hypothetical protein [Bacillus altitudinis]
MSVEMYHGERSKESIQFETLFASQSNKESFSSIEQTKKFLEQKGIENTQKIGERTFELMIVVLLIVSFSYLTTSENVSLSTDIPDSSLLIAVTPSFLQNFSQS